MGISPFDDANGAAPVEQTPIDDEGLRLRLHHLFVLTAVMAVLLGINGPQTDYASPNYEPPPFLRMLWLAVRVTHTLLSAVGLTAFGYGIAWYRRGLRFFDQPAHWLLAEISLTALLGIVPSIAYRWLGSSKQTTWGDTRMVISFAVMGYTVLFLFLGRILINIYLGKKKCTERRWKFVFYAKALGAVLLGLGGFVVIPTTIHALRADRREQVARDAGHWCGVALQLALSSLTLVSSATTFYGLLTMMRR